MTNNQKLTLDTRVARRDDVLASKLDGETVLFDVAAGNYYAYDAMGSRIWDLLAEPQTVGQICQALTREFAVDAERCEREVLSFLSDLSAHGLLQHERFDRQAPGA